MNLEEILALRPKDATAEQIRAALQKAGSAVETLRVQADELAEKRAASLLSADDAELLSTEQAASRNRLAADRIVILIGQMEQDLKAAIAREAADRVHAAVLEVNGQAEQFMAAWRKDYPKAAGMIVRLLEMDRAHVQAMEQLAAIVREAHEDGAEAREDTPAVITPRQELFHSWMAEIGNAIQLPSVDGCLNHSAFWRPNKLETRSTASDDVATARARPLEVVSNPAPLEPPLWRPGLQSDPQFIHATPEREAG